MRADAAGEGRRDAAMLDIEFGVTDLSFGVVHGGLSGALFVRALVDGLRGNCYVAAPLQYLSTIEFAIREHEPRACVSSCALAWASLIS